MSDLSRGARLSGGGVDGHASQQDTGCARDWAPCFCACPSRKFDANEDSFSTKPKSPYQSADGPFGDGVDKVCDPGMQMSVSSLEQWQQMGQQLKVETTTAKPRTASASSVQGADEELLYRGASVAHLSQDIFQTMGDVGLPRDSKVYEIEEQVIRAVGKDRVCPRDGKVGTAYVDAISGVDHAGTAHFMLSYTWGYEMSEISDTLLKFCDDMGSIPRRTYCWICCLCVNQHRVKEAQATGIPVSFNAFSQTFGERVKGIGHLVCMMSPWNDPYYIKRVWCNFEMYTALADSTSKVSIVMPPRSIEEFETSLLHGQGLNDIWKIFGNLDCEHSQASVAADKDNIFHLIKDGPGFHKLNTAVCGALRKWLVDSCEKGIKKHIELKDIKEEALAVLCRKLGTLVRKLGNLDRALELYQVARDLREQSVTFESEAGAALMRSIGATQGSKGQAVAQMQSYQEACDILQLIGKLESNEAAVLFDHMGDAKKHARDFDGTLSYFKRSRDIYERLGELESADAAYLLKNMAEVKLHNYDWKGAKADYEEALENYSKRGQDNSPDAALIIKGLGDVCRKTYDDNEAICLYKKAKRIREKTGTLKTLAGSALLLDLYILESHKEETKKRSNASLIVLSAQDSTRKSGLGLIQKKTRSFMRD